MSLSCMLINSIKEALKQSDNLVHINFRACCFYFSNFIGVSGVSWSGFVYSFLITLTAVPVGVNSSRQKDSALI